MQLYGLYRATSIPVSSTNQGTLSYPISLRSHLQSRDDRARRSTGVGRPEPAVRKRGAGGGRAFPDRLLSSGEAVYMLDWPSLYGFISHQLCSHCSIYLQTFSMSLLLMLMPPTPPKSLLLMLMPPTPPIRCTVRVTLQDLLLSQQHARPLVEALLKYQISCNIPLEGRPQPSPVALSLAGQAAALLR